MIRHVVFFRFIKNHILSLDELCTVAIAHLNELSGLSCIESMAVHKNIMYSPYANYDLMIDCSFQSFGQLQQYQQHQLHTAFVQWLQTVISDRACVDYQV
ncbi:Dabb family protein [Lacibacter sp.]|uniref:Dabb family protein n=1 Tax=Lacibacter sp. TaxID=1915409 RepID=UPI002B4AF65E|nr:Dabb family protein [Lacibacter sp.]HLP37666.1 Dabb family protein [Lacibacter sp.]